jgi:hypothetical protein
MLSRCKGETSTTNARDGWSARLGAGSIVDLDSEVVEGVTYRQVFDSTMFEPVYDEPETQTQEQE